MTRTLAVLFASFAFAANAQTPGSTSPPDSVIARAGVFRAGTSHDIAIVPFRTGAGWTLMLADVQTDALRLVWPSSGKGVFTIGAELARPTPVEWTLRFLSSGALSIDPGSNATPFAARRIPIDAVPVSFTNGSLKLQGSLYRPHSHDGRLPLVVLAHGSEDNDRYSFGPVPLVLASRGFAVLAYDKRGTGKSTGSWKTSGVEDYADDLVAGIRAIIHRPDVDSMRVAVLGFSEGGWVAPRAASRTKLIKAIAAISGGARTKGDAYIYKTRREAEAKHASPAQVDSVVKEAARFIAASVSRAHKGDSASGFDRRISYDPANDWRAFKGPVLYMGGEADTQESAPEAAAWFRRLFRESGNVDTTIKLWPRAHHGLLLGITGEPSEFQTLSGVSQLAPGYWDVLLSWMSSHLQTR